MIRTKPDEEFDVPEGGELRHMQHEDQGLYVYFYVVHADDEPAE
jgi:hypothetical protein